MEPLKDHICIIKDCGKPAFKKLTVCEEHNKPKKEAAPA